MKKTTGKILSLVFLLQLVFITCISSVNAEGIKIQKSESKSHITTDSKNTTAGLQLIAELEELEEEDALEKTHLFPLFVYSVLLNDSKYFRLNHTVQICTEGFISVVSGLIPVYKKTHSFLI